MRLGVQLSAFALILLPLVGIGCVFDMDEDWPEYEGEIDLEMVDVDVACTPDADPSTGTWDLVVFVEGWAEIFWVELWSLEDDYCEGFDSATGDPCDNDGESRPGWDMDQYDYGFDDELGHWDEWELLLGFDAVSWPPSSDESYLGCDDNLELYVCGCDESSGACYCSDPILP